MFHRRSKTSAGYGSAPEAPEFAVVDIWQLDDGLISEGWEIIEPVSRAVANLPWWAPSRMS